MRLGLAPPSRPRHEGGHSGFQMAATGFDGLSDVAAAESAIEALIGVLAGALVRV